jgi:cobalt-zinc-cadmium efflux system membrane fusion protein
MRFTDLHFPSFRPSGSPRGRLATRLAWIALLAAGGGGVVLGATSQNPSPEPAATTAKTPAADADSFKPTPAQMASLKIATVASSNFRAEDLTDGKISINGDRTTPVFSPYSGRVTRVIANPGDTVQQGQPLLALEASEFVQGQNDLLASQAAAATAHAQLALAQATEQRKHALFDAKAGAMQDWQQSQADLAAAQSSLRSADAAFAAVRNRLRILGKTEAEIDALARAEKIDPSAYVVAPIAGTVTDRQVGLGQYLQSGASTPVYTIGDLAAVWLVANVREADAPMMRKGAPIEVHVNALPDRVFKARITYVAPALDPATRRLVVRAEVQNAEGLLKPEMFATFSILTGSETAAPAVPDSGVVYEGPDARVWVLGDDGALALRKIRPGRSANGLLEVLDGLAAGEKVVVGGALFIDRAAHSD